MYRFALCGDEQKELDKTNELLGLYGESHPYMEFTVQHFPTVETMLWAVDAGEAFDLLLLDMHIPGKTGIEGARELRQRSCLSPIIFMTTSREHALEAFSVQPVHYLVKPVAQIDFFAAMDLVCGFFEDWCRGYIIVKTRGELRRIAVRDILYCEAHNNYQYINLASGSCICSRITSVEMFARLKPFFCFARCGAAYIVNLSHVVSVKSKEIRLDSGGSIPVPRGVYSVFKEQYYRFYGDKPCQ